jgi:Domain of unknown function (DUF4332)
MQQARRLEDHRRVPPLTELTRIEPVYLERLEKQGIFTTGILLEVSETSTRRQYLADHVGASPVQVMEWRDEGLMLNLADFGPTEHVLLMQAGFPGLESILRTDLETFMARVQRTAQQLKIEPPSDLTITGWWEQARTLETLPDPKPALPPADPAGAVLRLLIGAIVGSVGAVLAAGLTPANPPLAAIAVVVLVLGVTGAVGRLAAGGVAGFAGLIGASFAVLSILLGRGLIVALPDTPLWRDQGIAVNLPVTGLLATLIGWGIAWVAGQVGRRPTFGRASQRAA